LEDLKSGGRRIKISGEEEGFYSQSTSGYLSARTPISIRNFPRSQTHSNGENVAGTFGFYSNPGENGLNLAITQERKKGGKRA